MMLAGVEMKVGAFAAFQGRDHAAAGWSQVLGAFDHCSGSH